MPVCMYIVHRDITVHNSNVWKVTISSGKSGNVAEFNREIDPMAVKCWGCCQGNVFTVNITFAATLVFSSIMYACLLIFLAVRYVGNRDLGIGVLRVGETLQCMDMGHRLCNDVSRYLFRGVFFRPYLSFPFSLPLSHFPSVPPPRSGPSNTAKGFGERYISAPWGRTTFVANRHVSWALKTKNALRPGLPPTHFRHIKNPMGTCLVDAE